MKYIIWILISALLFGIGIKKEEKWWWLILPSGISLTIALLVSYLYFVLGYSIYFVIGG